MGSCTSNVAYEGGSSAARAFHRSDVQPLIRHRPFPVHVETRNSQATSEASWSRGIVTCELQTGLKSIVHLKQSTEYLSGNRLLPRFQSAYRRGHSTETALLKVFSDVVNAIDSGQLALLSLLDMSAAFDTIDHYILMQRLSLSFGIKDRALSWLESNIKGRTQSVHLSRDETSPRLVTCGVPQGSVLGPLLFVLYTADLERIIETHGLLHHCYADDTQLYFFVIHHKPLI